MQNHQPIIMTFGQPQPIPKHYQPAPAAGKPQAVGRQMSTPSSTATHYPQSAYPYPPYRRPASSSPPSAPRHQSDPMKPGSRDRTMSYQAPARNAAVCRDGGRRLGEPKPAAGGREYILDGTGQINLRDYQIPSEVDESSLQRRLAENNNDINETGQQEAQLTQQQQQRPVTEPG